MMFLYQEFPLQIHIHICVVTKGVTEDILLQKKGDFRTTRR